MEESEVLCLNLVLLRFQVLCLNLANNQLSYQHTAGDHYGESRVKSVNIVLLMLSIIITILFIVLLILSSIISIIFTILFIAQLILSSIIIIVSIVIITIFSIVLIVVSIKS